MPNDPKLVITVKAGSHDLYCRPVGENLEIEIFDRNKKFSAGRIRINKTWAEDLSLVLQDFIHDRLEKVRFVSR